MNLTRLRKLEESDDSKKTIQSWKMVDRERRRWIEVISPRGCWLVLTFQN
jgi:hypothetical protein